MEPVNVFGKIVQNMELLSRLEVGDLIRMEVIE
ncbi:MAG: hypothetical protein ACTSRC_15935 [Candidatus Helarchaeota archaeon]